MRITVKFFAYFRDLFAAREKVIELEPDSTIAELLGIICDTPGRRQEVFAGREIKPHLIVMINGVPANSLGGLEAPLHAGDMVAVFPFLAGG